MSQFVEYVVPRWRNLNMRILKVDQCYVQLKSHLTENSYLYSLSSDCFQCPYERLEKLPPHTDDDEQHTLDKVQALRLDVSYGLKFKLFANDVGQYALANESALCELDGSDMREFGVYNLTVLPTGTCELNTDLEGVNVNLSLLSAFVLVSLLLIFAKISWCAWRTYRYEEQAEPVTVSNSQNSTPDRTPQRNRLRSLDAFRGFAIVLMIFVNSGGGHYWWIEHATWNGLHLADVVFPCFLWIMGVCIPISIRSQLVRGNSKCRICLRIAWRSIKLFAIGLCLNSLNGPQLEQLRIMGVLQRFGVAFFVCSVLHTIYSHAHQAQPIPQLQQMPRWKQIMQDILVLRWELITMLVLIIIHLGIVFGMPVPGCPRGYLGPGGKHENASHINCTGGVTGWIDIQVLGNAHIYQHPTAKYVYNASAFDPEGIFGCLLTVVQVLFGLLAGVIILNHEHRCRRWLTWALILSLLGGALCTFSQDNGLIPINKNLWSLSFVFVTSSLAFAVLTVLYYIIDVQHWWTGWPFVEAGMNAIIMYVGHTIMHKMLPWHWKIGSMNTHFVLLLESLWNTMLWVAIAVYLDNIKFYYSL